MGPATRAVFVVGAVALASLTTVDDDVIRIEGLHDAAGGGSACVAPQCKGGLGLGSGLVSTEEQRRFSDPGISPKGEKRRSSAAVAQVQNLHPALKAHEDLLRSGTLDIGSSYHIEASNLPSYNPEERAEAQRGILGPGLGHAEVEPGVRDLVIALAWDTEAETARFARSLFRVAPGSRFLLIVPSEEERQRKAYLQSWGAELHVHEFEAPAATGRGTERFVAFAKVLKDHAGEALRIMVCDVRDVIFQSDPFPLVPPGKILVGVEDRRLTFGSCPYNTHAMKEALGGQFVEELRDLPVICSGVTIGDARLMMEFVLLMASFATQLAANVGGYRNIRGLSDQALFNCLIGRCSAMRLQGKGRVLDSVLQVPNERSPIYTMGWVPHGEIRVDLFGRVLNPSGQVPAVLHQMDRHPRVMRLLNQQYPIYLNGSDFP